MTRQPRVDNVESSEALAKKLEVLEREMAFQRQAMDRLKELAATAHPPGARRHGDRAGRLTRR